MTTTAQAAAIARTRAKFAAMTEAQQRAFIRDGLRDIAARETAAAQSFNATMAEIAANHHE